MRRQNSALLCASLMLLGQLAGGRALAQQADPGGANDVSDNPEPSERSAAPEADAPEADAPEADAAQAAQAAQAPAREAPTTSAEADTGNTLSTPPPPAAVQASAHFKRGLSLFAQDAHEAALLEFRRAHALSPDFHVRFNIAQCLVLLGRYPEALRSFESYLQEGGSRETSGRAKLVAAQLKALRGRLGKLAIEVNLEGSEVFVDDARVGESPLPTTLALNGGMHRVFVRPPGQLGESRVVEVQPGKMVEVRFDLLTTPIVEESVPQPAPVDLVNPRTAMLRKLMFGSLAGSGATLVGATVAAMAANDADDALQRELEQRPADPLAVDQARSMLQRYALLTDTMWVGSVLLGATAAVCWWMDREERELGQPAGKAGIQLSVSPLGVSAHGHFQ